MKNKKTTSKKADTETSYYYDCSSNEERKKLLKNIEEAYQKDDRARCYELIIDYFYIEPYEIDSRKFGEAKYHIFFPGLGPSIFFISNRYPLKKILMYMDILTSLYERGFFCKEGSFIVKAFNTKAKALITAEKALDILNRIYQVFNYDICEEQIAREIYVYGNEKHRPKWMDENGENPSLEQWRNHPEEWIERISPVK